MQDQRIVLADILESSPMRKVARRRIWAKMAYASNALLAGAYCTVMGRSRKMPDAHAEPQFEEKLQRGLGCIRCQSIKDKPIKSTNTNIPGNTIL